jgi:hypothetical protein
MLEAMTLPMSSYRVDVQPSLLPTEDTTNMAQRKFQFFVTTEQPHQPEGAQRDLIRRLVMRNFFESKGSGVEKEGESSEMSSEATMKAKGRLKTRRRAATSRGGRQKEELKKRRNVRWLGPTQLPPKVLSKV